MSETMFGQQQTMFNPYNTAQDWANYGSLFNMSPQDAAMFKLNNNYGMNTTDLKAIAPTANPNNNMSMFTKFGNYMNSNAGQGLMSGLGAGMSLFNMYQGYKAYKANQKLMKQQMAMQEYAFNKTKQENLRTEKQRRDVTSSYQNGTVV